MSTLPCPPEEWPRFSALLDRYLELEPEAREQWLSALPATDAHYSQRLRSVITRAAQRTSEKFLDRPSGGEPVSAFTAGQRIGPWQLVRALGTGGMGGVWLASRVDGAYTRDVALKLPHAHVLSSALRDHFRRERDILASLTDPRIASFYDAGVAEGGQPWLALEFVEGTPLREYCEREQLGVRERVALVREVAAAVQSAHARLVVHRDLKPANVLAMGSGQIKLLDFGIAKLLDDSADAGLTQAGASAASPDYAAPEQLRGGNVTVATDVFGLGVMLYELLTGQRPFPPRSRLARMLDDRGDAPRASTRVNGKLRTAIAGDLDAILMRAMEPEPAQRYASVEAFSEDLGRFLDHQPVKARHLDAWRRGLKFLRRNRRGVTVAAASSLAMLAGVAGIWWQSQRTAEEARRANAIRDFLVETFEASDPRIASDTPRGSIPARALLDAGAARIESRFADDPVVQIELLRTLATLYAQLGEDERYEKLQALQLAKARQHFGPHHDNLLDGAVEAAQRACTRGQRERCASLVAHADDLLREAGEREPLRRAEWWLARAWQLQQEDGRIEATGEAFRNAVDLYRRHDPRSRGHVTALHELANYQNAWKLDYEGAIATFNEALKLAQSLPERNDAELQTLFGNLGLIHQQVGDFRAASEAFRKSADIAERTTGADFPTSWFPRAQSARTLHLAGERVAAHEQFSKLIPLLPTDGRHALDVANVRELYGERLAQEGRPELGIPHLEAALASHSSQGAFSFKARLARRYLGEAYARAGRHADAGRTLRAALDEYLSQQPDAQQPVMAMRESYGRWLLADGKSAQAAEQFSNVVTHAEGRTLAHIALAQAGLARVALANADATTALRESEQALATWSQVTGFRDARMGPYLQRVRADALAAAGRVAEAQSLEDEAAAVSRRFDDAESVTTRRRVMSGSP